jgi:hypothetical protein
LSYPSRKDLLGKAQETLAGKVSNLVKTVPTRLSSVYRTLSSLKTSRGPVKVALHQITDEAETATGNKQAALQWEKRLQDEQFWTAIDWTMAVLEAIVKAHDALDQEGTRLRMVLPAVKGIFNVLDPSAECGIDPADAVKMQDYFSARMARFWNTDLLILATVLDPKTKDSIFNKMAVHMIHIVETAEKVYSVLFKEPCKDLGGALMEYLENKPNSRLSTEYYLRYEGVDSIALARNTFWKSIGSIPIYAELSKLALHLESCVCNSGPAERLVAEMPVTTNPPSANRLLEATQMREYVRSKRRTEPKELEVKIVTDENIQPELTGQPLYAEEPDEEGDDEETFPEGESYRQYAVDGLYTPSGDLWNHYNSNTWGDPDLYRPPSSWTGQDLFGSQR